MLQRAPPAGLLSGFLSLSRCPLLSPWRLAVTTPPRSGPFCRTACIGYPYTDAAAFVPRDYLWMYPAAVLALLFVTLVACVSYFASPDARL